MVRVYGYPNTRSTRVVWALEEAGAQYEYTPINISKGEHWSAEFLAINPFGKLPAVVDDGHVITESGAICTYIAEKFPAARLIPDMTDLASRAAYFQWILFTVSELEAHLWTMAKHTRLWPEAKRIAGVAESELAQFNDAAVVLADYLQDRTYMAADHFTAADIMATSILNWAASANIRLPDRLIAYKQDMTARPAFAAARAREAASIT